MKRFRVFSIALLTIQALALVSQAYAAGAATSASTWLRYDSPDGRISAIMPLKPTVSKSPDGYHMLAAPNDNIAYMVAYRHLHWAAEGQPGRAFAGVLSAFRKKGYTVYTARRVRVDGHPGQEVHIKTNDGFYAWDRMFLVGEGFYQLLYTSKLDDPAPSRFWRSMVLNR